MDCLNMRVQTHSVAQLNCKAFPKRGLFVMEDSDKSKKPAKATEMENLASDISTSTSRFSRDLLQRFMGSGSSETASSKHVETLREEEQDEDDIELNLGLSLGGKFGVDKISTNLMRSSSIASCLPVVRDGNESAVTAPPPVAANVSGSLTRTSSLPVETEEEWRKRKELQCLRRMEAKRRRSEKQKNMMRTESGFSRVQSLSADEKRGIELNLRERLEREKAVIGIKRSSSSQFGSSSNRVVSLLGNVRGGVDVVSMEKGKGSLSGFSSQGSIESKGGSSSSDFETKSLQGSSGDLSPASIQSLPNQRPDKENPCKLRSDTSSSMGDNMPCVFTKGDGPHGKRVDGILYKYGKGEQVKIVCVCHGTFHSPSEFIRHAGGTDVDNPLKHIVVNPNSSGMLL